MKVVLLIWYSNKNFCFRKIRSHLAPKIDFEIWKCPIFDGSSSNSFTRYKQILSGCSFVTKKLLYFTWLPMKFQNRGHISAYSLVDVAKVCVEDGDQAFVYEGPIEKVNQFTLLPSFYVHIIFCYIQSRAFEVGRFLIHEAKCWFSRGHLTNF